MKTQEMKLLMMRVNKKRVRSRKESQSYLEVLRVCVCQLNHQKFQRMVCVLNVGKRRNIGCSGDDHTEFNILFQ